MEVILIVDAPGFSQTKITLSPRETVEVQKPEAPDIEEDATEVQKPEAPDIEEDATEVQKPEAPSIQTIYVQSGTGAIKTSTEQRYLGARSIEVIEVDSQLEISNTGLTLLTLILTAGK